MNAPQLALLDWSGTIMNNLEESYTAIMRIFDIFGVKRMTLKRFRETYRIPWMSFYKQFGVSEEELMEHMDEIESITRLARNATKPFRSVKEILPWLNERGIRVCIVTDDSHEEVSLHLKKFGLDRWISKIYTSEVYPPKPSPRVINTAIDEHDVGKKRSFIVGDMAQDIQAGKRAGIWTVAFLRGWHSQRILMREGPDFCIDDLNELKNIIR